MTTTTMMIAVVVAAVPDCQLCSLFPGCSSVFGVKDYESFRTTLGCLQKVVDLVSSSPIVTHPKTENQPVIPNNQTTSQHLKDNSVGNAVPAESTTTSLPLMKLRTSSNHHDKLHQRRRHNQQFSQPHCWTQYQQYSFLPRTIRDWNDLPQEVIEAKTIDTLVSGASRLQ